MSLAPGTRLGVYGVTAQIGEGGMGQVYQATDTRLKRQVAIKILPPSLAADHDRLARLQREAEVLASLNHPNIAGIHGLEESGGMTALVMELVEGEDLSRRIARGAIPLDDALPIAKQIADALEAAHEQGIIHRDLKPANIKVRTDGTVKVLDFGLAKAMAPVGAMSPSMSHSPTITTPAMTQLGLILGTAAYMAPEQARGKAVDRRADIWAFGAVLYEMLSGQRAFDGDDISITLASVLKDDARWDALPPDLPASVRRLLRRCLEKDPRRRLQAVGEARIAIGEVLSGTGGETADSLKASPLRSGGLAWKIAAGVLAVASVGLGAVAVLHFREHAPAKELVRFQIQAAEGYQAFGQPIISPDGRRVAFAAVGQDGPPLLWVHSLDASASRPLQGTEGVSGTTIFWSPDSEFVAFTAGFKLKKVPASGGPTQPICDIPRTARGGTWSRDGVIVFGIQNQGLMQVPAAGGAASVLLALDATRKETTKAEPRFLPDGRHFVYWSVSPEDPPGQGSIYLGSLDGAPAQQTSKRLVAAAAIGAYAPSPAPGLGYLVFGRAGSLMAQAFDTRRMEIIGEAVPIAADVNDGPGGASASTTGVLVYGSRAGAGKFQLTWFDRTGKTLGAESLAGDLQAPNLSRDGRRVAIERVTAGASDVWIIDLSRGTTTRVTDDPGDDQRPVFSPDGTRVAFTRANVMYQKAASGTGDEERLADGETTDWSPDGRFISFIREGDLWALPLSGDRTPIRIAGGRFNDRRGRFSPDSKWIAYESNLSGRLEIYLQQFPPTADRMQLSVNGGDSAYWRSDGKELYFHAPDGHIMAVDITPGPTPGPSVPRPVFRLPADVNNGRFVAMPDGQRFLVPLEVQKPTPPVMTVVLNWFEALKNQVATRK